MGSIRHLQCVSEAVISTKSPIFLPMTKLLSVPHGNKDRFSIQCRATGVKLTAFLSLYRQNEI